MESSGSDGKRPDNLKRPEGMAPGGSGERPFTRHQKQQEEDKKRKVEEKEQREAKRLTLFKPRKVIGPRDIKVNRALGKIHVVEEVDVKPEVKLEHEPEGDSVGLEGSFDGGEQDEIVIVKEEVDLPMDLEVETEIEDQVGFQRKEEEVEVAEGVTGNLEQMDDIGDEPLTTAGDEKSDENFVLEVSAGGNKSSEMNDSLGSCSDEALRRENLLLKERIQLLEKKMQKLMNNSGKANSNEEICISHEDDEGNGHVTTSDGMLKESMNLQAAGENVSTQEGCQDANELAESSESIAAPMDEEDISIADVIGTVGRNIAVAILAELYFDAARMALVAKKVNELFPQVAKIIWKKYGTSELSVQDFLTARLVNTAWRNGVDQLPQGPSHLLQVRRSVGVPICCLKHAKEFADAVKQEGMLPRSCLAFTTYPNCDYITMSEVKIGEYVLKNARLGTRDSDKRPEFKEVITNLIKEFGSNISYLNYFEPVGTEIAIANLFESNMDWYAALVDWLQLMPNLEYVQAYCHFKDVISEELSNLVTSRPFPKLPQVKEFSCIRIPAVILRSLVLNNCQVSSLHASFNPNRRTDEIINSSLDGISLPNLKKLTIISTDMSDQNFVKNLQHLDAPCLEIFSLDADTERGERYTSSVIHGVFSKFQATLQYVDLQVTLNLEHEHFKRFPDLPKLKLLSLKFSCVMKNPNRLEKLVEPLQSLEYLKLRENKVHDQDACSGHQRKDLKNGLVSRLWELIPNLRHVVILSVHRHCKRERYDFYRQIDNSTVADANLP